MTTLYDNYKIHLQAFSPEESTINNIRSYLVTGDEGSYQINFKFIIHNTPPTSIHIKPFSFDECVNQIKEMIDNKLTDHGEYSTVDKNPFVEKVVSWEKTS